MGLKEKMYSNVKKPEGFLGKRVLSRMNGGLHAQLADWGIGFLGDMKAESVIDLGCGGGRNVSEFLKRFPDAFVRGLDYSETSVAKASKVNRVCVLVKKNLSERIKLALRFFGVYFFVCRKQKIFYRRAHRIAVNMRTFKLTNA